MSPAVTLFTLAIGAFAIGTTEFTPMGLITVIADDMQVSIPTAGMLVSAYAVGVMLGAPVMTLLLARIGKRAALMLLMLIFALGNLMSALAPGYETLLLSRLVTSLSHGAFFGIAAVVAASVVPREKQGSAIAAMFMGLTIANVGGVPAATWIGQQLGWRLAMGGTAVLGLLTIVALWLALPAGEPGNRPAVRRELAVLSRRPVLLALATTVLGSGAMFTLYTYVAAILADITRASPGFVAFTLVLIGIGFTLGNSIGGRLANWSLDGASKLILTVQVIVMAGLPLLLHTQLGAAIGLVVWGAAAFGIAPSVQMRVMQAASQAPGLASSVNIGAFNLGNALGAALGGLVIDLGFGYAAIPVAGAVLAAAALGVVFLGQGAARRDCVQGT